jgi:hypothetical protein
LARIQAARGQVDLAGQTVSAVYRRFTEGFDTAGLQTARRQAAPGVTGEARYDRHDPDSC